MDKLYWVYVGEDKYPSFGMEILLEFSCGMDKTTKDVYWSLTRPLSNDFVCKIFLNLSCLCSSKFFELVMVC